MHMMPLVRFRDYVCEGLGKSEDDKMARTYPVYLRLELAQALAAAEDEEVVRDGTVR